MSQFDTKQPITLRTGKGGSGKSWSAVVYLVEDFLPNNVGKVFTNLPLNVEAIVEYVAKKTGKPKESIAERIVIIPKEVEELWLEGLETPASYFQRLEKEDREANNVPADDPDYLPPHSGAIAIIDEAAKMWPSKMDNKAREAITSEFNRWLRTVRHEGLRLILICQDSVSLSAALRRLAANEFHAHDLGDDREIVTGSKYGDWCQVVAKWWGSPVGWIAEVETVQHTPGNWEETRRYTRFRWPFYFRFYNSFSREGKSGSKQAREEWERLGWIRLFLWFIKRNWIGVGIRLGGLALLYVVFGFPWGPFGLAWQALKHGPAMITAWLSDDSISIAPDGASIPRGTYQPVKGTPGSMTQTAAEIPPHALGDRFEMVDLSGVVMDDGSRYSIGEPIQGGQFDGKRVISVDVLRGVVYFDDGTRERLRTQAAALAPSAVAEVRSGSESQGQAGRNPAGGSRSTEARTPDDNGGKVQVR